MEQGSQRGRLRLNYVTDHGKYELNGKLLPIILLAANPEKETENKNKIYSYNIIINNNSIIIITYFIKSALLRNVSYRYNDKIKQGPLRKYQVVVSLTDEYTSKRTCRVTNNMK